MNVSSHQFHPRSQSLTSNGAFSAAQVPANSLSALQNPSLLYPQPHQITLVGIEELNGCGEYEAQLKRPSIANGAFARKSSKVDNYHRSHYAHSQHLSSYWLERVFQKRDCIKFIPADHSDRCQCGRASSAHSQLALSRFTTSVVTRGAFSTGATIVRENSQNICNEQTEEVAAGKWTIGGCTTGSPTDAYGTIEFQGGAHVHKARYVRLSFDSDPANVMRLMERVWGLARPRLIISVHGGITDFEVPESLGKVFREGLLKAAETTGAWVLTSGLDCGVIKHVARALDEAGISARMRSRIVTVGIAPWGLLRRREQLIGRHAHVPYDRHQNSHLHSAVSASSSSSVILNDRHSYFLLADNGTVGRHGADIVLRRHFEEYLARASGGACRPIPIVCVALEGGLCTLESIHRYLSETPTIPVIVCEGSGRVSDLLSFAAHNLDANGCLPSRIRHQLLARVRHLTCNSGIGVHRSHSAEALVDRIVQCVRQKDKLLTIFRLQGTAVTDQQMDQSILRALLYGQNLSPAEQLLLTLAWGREDIARKEVFGRREGRCPIDSSALVRPMMDALLAGRVDFVKLFLEQGLSLKRFLTFERLEELYNAEQTLGTLMNGRRGTQLVQKGAFTLPEIGMAIERLMGNAFRSTYTTRAFKVAYERAKFGGIHPMRRNATKNFSSLHMCLGGAESQDEEASPSPVLNLQIVVEMRKCALAGGTSADERLIGFGQRANFAYPFNELMLWAVLTRRHEMAQLFWQYGEESLAKALTAIRLYKCMSREAAHDYTEVEVSNQLRECANEFREWSLELLHHCHQQDSQLTMRLLTAELPNWGHHTCLSLAVIANNKRFLAHPCCQILMAELWHGGLRFKSQSNVKVVLGILFPPSILLLDFKQSSTRNTASGNSCSYCLSLCSCRETEEEGAKKAFGGGEDENLLARTEEPQTQLNGEDNWRERVSAGYSRSRSEIWPQSGLASALSKLVLFYRAPITSFWVWCMSFLVFMFALIYVLLVEFPTDQLPTIEWLLFSYVLAFGLEHFRKLFVLESSSLLEKLRVFYSRYWNILTTVTVLTYFLGLAFRFNPATVHTYSRVILAANSVLWHMKLFDFLSVHPRIGPYITMAGKMVLAMSYIIVLLMVTLMAFGVARQSITFPHEKWAWILVRNIFYKPYFMLYGEVYAGEIDTCGDEGTNCVPGGWIPPVLMTIFLLVANILLINMLIAIFNNIFNVTNAMSQQVWMFQRYEQVLEYKSTPILPPPFTPLAHAVMLLRSLCRSKGVCPLHANSSATKSIDDGDFALKVQLPAEELRDLQDFEEDCMDDLSRQKCRNSTATADEMEQERDRRVSESSRDGRDLSLQQLSAQMQRVLTELERLANGQQQLAAILDQGTLADGVAVDAKPAKKKLVPRAHIPPMAFSCSAPQPAEGESDRSRQRLGGGRLQSSPHIFAVGGEEEEGEGVEGRTDIFYEVQSQEVESPSAAHTTRRRPNSASLSDDLEQMLGVLSANR